MVILLLLTEILSAIYFGNLLIDFKDYILPLSLTFFLCFLSLLASILSSV
jgi:uncharacterized protein HemY